MSWLYSKVFGETSSLPQNPQEQKLRSSSVDQKQISPQKSEVPTRQPETRPETQTHKPLQNQVQQSQHERRLSSSSTQSSGSQNPRPSEQPRRSSVQEEKKPKIDANALMAKLEEDIEGEIIARAEGNLFLMNDRGQNEQKAANVIAFLVKEEAYEYSLQIYDSTGKMKLNQPVSNEMQMNFHKVNHTIVWILLLNDRVHAWTLQFLEQEQENDFKMKLAVSLMEVARKEEFSKIVTKNDRDWVLKSHDAEDMDESKSEEKEGKDYDFDYDVPSTPTKNRNNFFSSSSATEKKNQRSPGSPQSADDEDDEEPARENKLKKSTNKRQSIFPLDAVSQNTNLAVGMANNRTFVLQGSKIGVFKHNENDELEYLNKIPTITDMEGNTFEPSKTLLSQRDSKMLMLNPLREDTVFCMDLERGQVVEEWNVAEEMKIRAFGPQEKYGQLTGEQGILGVNFNSLFSLDPRINKKNKMSEHYSYAKAPKMSCVGTNGSGQVAVGDLRGEIRLFSDISKKAKTLLPGLGDPVIGIDVTEDGHYIVATTSQYLLVIPTVIEGKKGRTGFDVSMGAAKPVPLKLQLDPKDLAKYNIGKVSFTAAHFNTGSSITEEWIVTSTGPFVITWDFSWVKLGQLKKYQIKKQTQEIVADQFRYNKEDQVVITCKEDVFVEKRHVTDRRKK